MKWRRGFIYVALVLIFIGIISRMLHLQISNRHYLKKQGTVRTERQVVIQAKRGLIKDRTGQVLAATTQLAAVAIDPTEIRTANPKWQQLIALLKLDPIVTDAKLKKYAKRRFMYLKRQITPSISEQVRHLRLPGVIVLTEYKRYYPQAEIFAPILGFTNIDSQGIEALERSYNGWLAGKNGLRRYEKDLKGRIIQSQYLAPEDGQDITLTIDSRLQAITYQALKKAVVKHQALAGTAVVLDVKTGAILAMASAPSFNPNDLKSITPGSTRNRVVTDVYEPGSLLKTFAMAQVLSSENYQPGDTIDTYPGRYYIGRRIVRDARNLGELSLTEVIQHSSNVGISKLLLTAKPEQFPDLLGELGFGKPTMIGFPGEQSGYLPVKRQWKPFALATLSFGYGVSATTLQVAQAYAVIARKGKHIEPSLLVRGQEPAAKLVLDPMVADQILAMLKTVVGEGGTAIQARVKGYEIAGKTGTARKATKGGYAENAYVTSFAGIAPANNPKLVMVVMIDDPKGDDYYGGSVAAPVFSEVMHRALPLLH